MSGGPELLGEYSVWWVGGKKLDSPPGPASGVSSNVRASEAKGSVLEVSGHSSGLTPGPESEISTVPFKEGGSSSGSLEIRTYLVFSTGDAKSLACSSTVVTR